MRPMLACKDATGLKFPLLASAKIDGVRALVKDGKVLSRSLKPIPNRHVQEMFGSLEGADGE
jgi:DNA ligase-1